MPLPLVPVFVVAGAAAWLGINEQGQAPGVVAHPDEGNPVVDKPRPPLEPLPISSPAGPIPPGHPPAPDPAMSVIEGAAGTAEQAAKVAVVGAASVAASTVAAGGTIGEGLGAAASSVGSSASSAASGAAGVVGPAAVVTADVLMVAGAFYDMFGGDLSNLIPTDAASLNPQQQAAWNALKASAVDPATGQTRPGVDLSRGLAQIEGRTGMKTITTAAGDEIVLGQNALTHETAAQAKARIAAEIANSSSGTIDPISGRPSGLIDRFILG